jgi:diguanylate cyclase
MSQQTPANLAKAALRRLAEQRLEPTPENYRKAYEAESGVPSSDGSVTDKSAEKPSQADANSQAEEGERWSKLIGRILRGAERGGRQWTAARKKDSLQRVLEGSKSSGQRLHQRLSQLVQSWDSDTLDNAPLEDDGDAQAAPTPIAEKPASETAVTLGTEALEASRTPPRVDEPPPDRPKGWPMSARNAVDDLVKTVHVALPPASISPRSQATATALSAAAQAQSSVSEACQQARGILEQRHRLLDQLMGLCQTLTDSLIDLAEDESWAQGQAQAMRHQLQQGIDSRGLRHVQQVLDDARIKQQTLKQERENAREALKQLIQQMLLEIGELGTTTDRFQSNLGRYADTIDQADSLESLTGVVREMVAESRSVQSVVAQTQIKLQEEHSKAQALGERVRSLEDEIRKLSDEVSTDPLTQIANRRGMMRAFEAEQARVERQGSPLAIGLLDVDNFKKLNDQLGHQTGDEALKFLARRVSESLRPVDVVARYGGEEFVVMLPDTPLEEGQQILTRLQRTLSAEFFTHDENKVFITFSAGVTAYRPGEPIEAALERADIGLYEAKRTGKNRTCAN